MLTYKLKIKELCDLGYKTNISQITIDLIQEEIEPILTDEEYPTRDSIGALGYQVGILLEVFSPEFTKDIHLLAGLKVALDEWEKDIENTNNILGLPKES